MLYSVTVGDGISDGTRNNSVCCQWKIWAMLLETADWQDRCADLGTQAILGGLGGDQVLHSLYSKQNPRIGVLALGSLNL
jgi:hypothetical protein